MLRHQLVQVCVLCISFVCRGLFAEEEACQRNPYRWTSSRRGSLSTILWREEVLKYIAFDCSQPYTSPYPTDLFREFVQHYSLKPRASEGYRERYLPPFTKRRSCGGLICAYVPNRWTPSEGSGMVSLNHHWIDTVDFYPRKFVQSYVAPHNFMTLPE